VAEIRKNMALRQPQGKKFVRPHLNGKKLGTVAHTCHPNEGRKHKIGKSWKK
jgi:hypothetical protein